MSDPQQGKGGSVEILHFVAPTVVWGTVLFLTLLPLIALVLVISIRGEITAEMFDQLFSRGCLGYIILMELLLIFVGPVGAIIASGVCYLLAFLFSLFLVQSFTLERGRGM